MFSLFSYLTKLVRKTAKTSGNLLDIKRPVRNSPGRLFIYLNEFKLKKSEYLKFQARNFKKSLKTAVWSDFELRPEHLRKMVQKIDILSEATFK